MSNPPFPVDPPADNAGFGPCEQEVAHNADWLAHWRAGRVGAAANAAAALSAPPPVPPPLDLTTIYGVWPQSPRHRRP